MCFASYNHTELSVHAPAQMGDLKGVWALLRMYLYCTITPPAAAHVMSYSRRWRLTHKLQPTSGQQKTWAQPKLLHVVCKQHFACVHAESA